MDDETENMFRVTKNTDDLVAEYSTLQHVVELHERLMEKLVAKYQNMWVQEHGFAPGSVVVKKRTEKRYVVVGFANEKHPAVYHPAKAVLRESVSKLKIRALLRDGKISDFVQEGYMVDYTPTSTEKVV